LEPSRPALCETISAVDGPRGVRLKRNLRGLATIRAHRVIHLTRATVVAASSAASVFVHSLPTIRTLEGTDGRLTGPILIKGAHPGRTPEIEGTGVREAMDPRARRSPLGVRPDGGAGGSPPRRSRPPPRRSGGKPSPRTGAVPCIRTPVGNVRPDPRSTRSRRSPDRA